MAKKNEHYHGKNPLEEEITRKKDWILGKYALNKVPEDRKLRTLLDGYTKEKMMELADENNFQAARR